MKSVVCMKCNWEHFPLTRAQVEKEVKEFNEYFYSLTKEEQDLFYCGKPSSIESYEKCFRCGHDEFKLGSSAPYGSTVQPIIYEE